MDDSMSAREEDKSGPEEESVSTASAQPIIEPIIDNIWDFIAFLDIPEIDKCDRDDISDSLREAGFKDVCGVSVAQFTNSPASGCQHYATASVGHPKADLDVSEVQIWAGFKNIPITMFQEECLAVFNVNANLLSNMIIQNISKQAAKLHLKFQYYQAYAKFEVHGSCNQVHKFREYLASLCVNQLVSKPEVAAVCKPPSITAVTAAATTTTEPTSSHVDSNKRYHNLSHDVLAFMQKTRKNLEVQYFPEEGCIEVTATDPERISSVISKFQDEYQKIINGGGSGSNLRTDVIDISKFKDQQKIIMEIIAEFEQKYGSCCFCYDPTYGSIKIISTSSRQFEQAKKLIADRIYSSAKGTNIEVLVLPYCVVKVKRGNMIDETADVFVNAANDQLQHWGGLAGALNTASHGELQKHSDVYINKNGKVSTGNVAITKAGGDLKCQHVIHAVGPDIEIARQNESLCEKLIFDAITSTLKKGCNVRAKSIVLPALSTGIFSVKAEISAKATFDAILSFDFHRRKEYLKDIRIVILDEPTYSCFANELGKRKSLIASQSSSQPTINTPLLHVNTPMLTASATPSTGASSSPITTQPGGSSAGESKFSDNYSIEYPELNNSNSLGQLPQSGSKPISENGSLPSSSNSSSASSNTGGKSSTILLTPGKLVLPDKLSTPKDSKEKSECPICLNSKATDPTTTKCCKQAFCKACLDQALIHSPYCPTCKKPIRKVVGNQPQGKMLFRYDSHQHLPGYSKCGTIIITYTFPDGIQQLNHPNPGKPYTGTTRVAYLPDNKEGQEVLKLLQKAFDARLVFTIGTSVTTGRSDTVVWNDIHHKTHTTGGSSNFGYPDSTYLSRVKEELKVKGIN